MDEQNNQIKQDQLKNAGGRPESYTVDYFPHYTIQSNPLKLVEHKFKLIGYAIYYKLHEILARSDHHYIDLRDDDGREILIMEIGVDAQTFDQVINYLCEKKFIDEKLFNEGIIFSPVFIELVDKVYSKRKNTAPTKDDVYDLIFKRKKESKKEKKVIVKDKEEYSIVKETQVSGEETQVSDSETINTDYIIKNGDDEFDEIGRQLVNDENYIRGKAQETGLKKDTIRHALTEFAICHKTSKSKDQFNFLFDQALKNNRDTLKSQELAATIYQAIPENTKTKKPEKPPLVLPSPDENKLDEVCKEVLKDATFLHWLRTDKAVKMYHEDTQSTYSYWPNKNELKTLVGLFGNEKYQKITDTATFQNNFRDWLNGYIVNGKVQVT